MMSWHEKFTETLIGQGYVKSKESLAFKAWQETPFPHFKQEDWKYIQWKFLNELTFGQEKRQKPSLNSENLSMNLSLEGSYNYLVFVDGVFNESLSSFNSEELTVSGNCQSEVFSNQAQKWFMKEQENVGGKNYFSLMNDAVADHKIFLHVSSSGKPILFYNISTSDQSVFFHKKYIYIESGIQPVFIDEKVTLNQSDNKSSFGNFKTHFFVEKQAQVEAAFVNSQGERNYSYEEVCLDVEKQAQVQLLTTTTEAEFFRSNLTVNLKGKEAGVICYGLTVGRKNDCIDYHTEINHEMAETKSDQLFKGILAEKAKSIFNGKIYIAPQAQKVDSSQLNKNLLLSRSAEVYTKPELDVHADDVKANHGAAIGEMSEEELFYLQSRGIEKEQAKLFLIEGYIQDVLSPFQSKELLSRVQKYLRASFEQIRSYV